MKEISDNAREKQDATSSIASCSNFLFFALALHPPLFQLSSNLRFNSLLASPQYFLFPSIYTYIHISIPNITLLNKKKRHLARKNWELITKLLACLNRGGGSRKKTRLDHKLGSILLSLSIQTSHNIKNKIRGKKKKNYWLSHLWSKGPKYIPLTIFAQLLKAKSS